MTPARSIHRALNGREYVGPHPVIDALRHDGYYIVERPKLIVTEPRVDIDSFATHSARYEDRYTTFRLTGQADLSILEYKHQTIHPSSDDRYRTYVEEELKREYGVALVEHLMNRGRGDGETTEAIS